MNKIILLLALLAVLAFTYEGSEVEDEPVNKGEARASAAPVEVMPVNPEGPIEPVEDMPVRPEGAVEPVEQMPPFDPEA